MGERKGSGLTFRRFLLAWFLLFVLITVVALRWLSGFLTDYENSRPKTTVKQYVEAFDDEHIRSISSGFLAGLDTGIESEDESLAVIREVFNGEMGFAKKSSESTDKKYVYNISVNGKTVGKVTVETQDDVDSLISTPKWEITGEEYDFTSLLKNDEITVDDGLSVLFNGRQLDNSYVSESGIEYDKLKDYYSLSKDMPHMATYSVSGYLGDHEFTVVDADGNILELPEDETERQSLFLNSCTEEQFARLESFSKEFVKRYVRFSANEHDNFYGNLTSLQEYVAPESALYARLPQAREGLSYSHIVSNEIKAITLNWAIGTAKDTWLADITYDVYAVSNTTEGKRVEQTTRNSINVIIGTYPDKGLLVDSMTVNESVVLDG